jgi:spore coat protein SA
MKLAIITSGYLPVPATRGGAVENLVENFIKENEEENEIDITIFSIYEKSACEKAKLYNNAKVKFIKPSKFVEILDKLIYSFAKNVLKKEKTMSYRYICQRIYFLNKVSKALKNDSYDKVLLENHATLFLSLKWRKNYKKYKDRYYYHLHNEITNDYGCKEIIKNCKKIICVSNYIVKQTREYLGKIKQENDNFTVLKNCIDENEFINNITQKKINEIKNKYKIEENEKVLLFTGRLTKEKGIKELLLSIKNVKNNNFKLLIVGSFFFDTNIKNNFENELKAIIEEIKDKVVFTGYIQYNDIPNIYKLADIAVLPSIWEDPAPLTIIEALKAGLPIITTRSGGIPEYVNNECAIILEKDNKEQLIKQLSLNINELLSKDEKVNIMSKKCIEVSKELTLNNYYNNFLKELS